MSNPAPPPAPPPAGAQGAVDRYSSPEHGGGALQSAQLPGARALPLGAHLHGRVWRSEDRGAGRC